MTLKTVQRYVNLAVAARMNQKTRTVVLMRQKRVLVNWRGVVKA